MRHGSAVGPTLQTIIRSILVRPGRTIDVDIENLGAECIQLGRSNKIIVRGGKLQYWVTIFKEYLERIAHLGRHWHGSLQPEMYAPCNIWVFDMSALATTPQ